jgi:ActR/RegA family two-component response regulator
MHPAQAFDRPMDVVNDIDLTLSEKRAILSAWASDACAVEAVPALRCVPGHAPVQFDDIMEALRVLDQQTAAFRKPQPHYRRVLERRGASPPSHRFDEGDDQGSRLH